ncbi:hypothetical protein AVEN_30065-1 [Araneus ventricosus]|uniref:Uncharacterized protein n=1 Tax=Araneus ventricosus TaxID=182803 RepID=A0A4Y2I699_ARAVE|nr:hypothetical protein AVEN_30065-1 [Araneus ventricosus]
MIFDKLKELELDLSVDKCKGLAFRSITHCRQRCAQNVFNRYPIVTNMESRFPAMLVLWLGREFYRGKYGILAAALCRPLTLAKNRRFQKMRPFSRYLYQEMKYA